MANTLICPHCGEATESRTLDSRTDKSDTYIRRRRKCAGCGKRYTTKELRRDPDRFRRFICTAWDLEVRHGTDGAFVRGACLALYNLLMSEGETDLALDMLWLSHVAHHRFSPHLETDEAPVFLRRQAI